MLAALAPALAAALATPGRADDALQPYQMVRSLQLVQDRIASGDHAAMPMQAKLLEMIDSRFRAAGADDFKDPKNLRALLVYGMSGGNPATIGSLATHVGMDKTDKAVADGVVDYLGGRPAAAIKAFEPIDPMTLPGDLGAFVALVKGSLLATEDPAHALRLLDEARLLSPGTLVEEAALRRSVGIAIDTGDAARFALASAQYAARFLYSPYASQFADSFVSGVIALHMSISLDKVADIAAMMDAEREKVIYLRIARRAAIDGLGDLSAFASARVEQNDGGRDRERDPRALLYASLSTMTSATVDDLGKTLSRIDRSQLSESDRSLLDAAKAIAHGMTAPPANAAAAPSRAATSPAPAASAEGGSNRQAAAAAPDATGLPPVEGIESERPAERAKPPETAVPETRTTTDQPAASTPAAAAGGPDTAQPDEPADRVIAEAKRKLDKIDQLLGASPQ
jgi:chemotaxis protein MotC